MHTFPVEFRSFEDVRDFVFLSMTRKFPISVSNGHQTVDAKSLMVMFSLDYSHPLEVRVECSDAEFSDFLELTARFRVS